jgi:hypothetical protein
MKTSPRFCVSTTRSIPTSVRSCPGTWSNPSIADLTAHLGIQRRSIENDIEFFRLFARKTVSTTDFGLKKIVTRNFVGALCSFPSSTLDLFLFLRLARAVALAAPSDIRIQRLSTANPRSRAISFSQIKRETICVK